MGEPPRTAPGAPPGLARRLLARVVPDAERPTVLGELDEMYRDRVGARGAAHARRWYWRQVMGFVVRGRGVRRAAAAGTREGTMAWFGDFLAERQSTENGVQPGVRIAEVAVGKFPFQDALGRLRQRSVVQGDPEVVDVEADHGHGRGPQNGQRRRMSRHGVQAGGHGPKVGGRQRGRQRDRPGRRGKASVAGGGRTREERGDP